MNAPKGAAADDIDFLVASPRAVRGTAAARAQPARPAPPAPAASTRRLHRLAPDSAAAWAEVAALVRREGGAAVRDASTLDQPSARQMGPVARHYTRARVPGKPGRVARGSTLLTPRWTDGERLLPVD